MIPNAVYMPPAGLKTILDEFKQSLNQKYALHLNTYEDLHRFSVTRMNDFWMTFWDFAGIRASRRADKAVDDRALIDHFPQFFEGARLNFAENMIAARENGLAILEINENNLASPEQYSWSNLRDMVRGYADALKSSNIAKGDVVALIGSNCVRSVAILLATAALGGIFSSLATDMGAKALDDRLQLLKPRILIAESKYSYNGKQHDISEKLKSLIGKLPKFYPVQCIIIDPTWRLSSPCISFEEFLARGAGRELEIEQVPFNTPFVVMFSSGTTGPPKGIVHSHGGLLLNGLKEFLLHNNLGPEDLHYQYTNIGWTLWNISLGALLVGTPLVLYDGSPFYPTAEGFLKQLFKHKITSFGAGPRYYSELQKLNVWPKQYSQHLHSIISTGAVLTPSLATWLAAAFGPVCQISMSGGTELCGAFLHGTRSLPSYPGEMAVKALGLDIAVFDPEQGTELPNGESGELVCRKPFPNMPAMFWNDQGRKRYFGAYFEKFPHVWTHGDFVQVNKETKGFYVLGRSDGVLNPSGVRFGSSEIYNILSTTAFTPHILDSLVVGQQRTVPPYSDSTEHVLLFVKCTPAATTGTLEPSPHLASAICGRIVSDLSRRHVPRWIFEVEEIPYNANGKKLEIQVKRVVCGGKEALGKLKLTEEERRVVEGFVRFFDVEGLVRGAESPSDGNSIAAKL